MIKFKDLIDAQGHASIPSGTDRIPRYAFNNCKNLVSIDIPSDVKEICTGAFKNCESLLAVIIPEGVTEIQESTFEGCVSLSKVDLPETVTSIGRKAFMKCRALTGIRIPQGVTVIDDFAFGNEHPKPYVSYQGWVESSGRDRPDEYTGLLVIDIPGGVTRIGVSAFAGCKNLAQVTLPDSITEISDDTFYNCGLTSVSIPEGVTRIGARAFRSCRSLADVVIPGSVTTLGEFAFSETNLSRVVIPEGVKTIERMAFDGRLTELKLPSTLEFIDVTNRLDNAAISTDNPKLSLTDSCLVDRQTGTLLRMYPSAARFPDHIKSLGEQPRHSYDPREWYIIGRDHLPDALNVEELKIPEGVEYVGCLPFGKMSRLKHLIFPASLKHLPDGFFEECLPGDFRQKSDVDTLTMSPDLFLSLSFKSWNKIIRIHLIGIESVDDELLAKIKAKCKSDKSLYVFFKGEAVYPSAKHLQKREDELKARAEARQAKAEEQAEAKRLETKKQQMSERIEDVSIKGICDSVLRDSGYVYSYYEWTNQLSIEFACGRRSRTGLTLENAKGIAEMMLDVAKRLSALASKFNDAQFRLRYYVSSECKNPLLIGFKRSSFAVESDVKPPLDVPDELMEELVTTLDAICRQYGDDAI